MSFSLEVKNELEKVLPNARHCQLAELSAINTFYKKAPDEKTPVGRKFFTLTKKTSMIDRYVGATVKNSCCKRAYLRGAFLCIGSIIDPNKGYNLEFVFDSKKELLVLLEYIKSFDIDAKITERKGSFVLYIKDAEAVVDTLNVLGAHKSLMIIENLRVERDFRALINRQVNCETANIAKSTKAALSQIQAIRKIEKNMGLDTLPQPLREMANVRLEHEESSLAELGKYMVPPVGKSGVNHRMRRLCEIADSIQD